MAAVLGLVAALVAAEPVAAQTPLTLEGALGRATTDAYAVRIAEGETVERSGDRLRALQGILPTVRFESGFMRTTDPVAAFGLSLRQRTITQEDFAPSRLNYPPVGENWTGAVVVEVPLLNPDAWLGLSAGGRATSAMAAAAEWQARSTRADVVRAYYGAVLAAEKVATLETATEAAAAHVRQAELLVEQGLVTKSDALLARVKGGEVEAELVGARGEARTAVRQLATLLGSPEERPVLPDGLPPAEAVRSVVGAGDAALTAAWARRWGGARTSVRPVSACPRPGGTCSGRGRRGCRGSTRSAATTGTRRTGCTRATRTGRWASWRSGRRWPGRRTRRSRARRRADGRW
ncbi:MAG: TolC family protein, partial [Gemmatimonadetes bacterium]|nr:TolC family protein [Gemmatimonadota bacterium]NIQ54542.1 TolC family protein [Gemmatimonadota bacterium]NIU74749.1 TolC family protein [Gammaproteobacteria bacterium]NIX44663.1 TolC family protein [Gemmatimonadota bacterium]NIY08892.1 TolC family protein [Gemmatimonadota bacterium]